VLVERCNTASKQQQRNNTKMVKSVINKPSTRVVGKTNNSNVQYRKTAIPAAFGYTERGQPANITSAGKDVRVKHCEYVGEIFGSVNFSLSPYTIQPASSILFPWLANMANLYETYTFLKLNFKYVPSKSTATNGAVFLAVDFDSTDAAPPSKTQLMAYNRYVRSPVWEDVLYQSDSKDLKVLQKRFIRNATVANTDAKLYDTGTFFIGTQGCADTTVIGELHVEYEVMFHTPQLDLGAYASGGSNRSTGNTGITNVLILGTNPSLNTTGSGINIAYNTTSGAFSLGQAGQFLISYQVSSATAYTGAVTITLTGGSVSSLPAYSASATLTILTFTVNMINATDTITIGGWVAGTTLSLAALRIASYPYNL